MWLEKHHMSRSSTRGSSTTALILRRKVTASLPSTSRWSYVRATYIMGRISTCQSRRRCITYGWVYRDTTEVTLFLVILLQQDVTVGLCRMSFLYMLSFYWGFQTKLKMPVSILYDVITLKLMICLYCGYINKMHGGVWLASCCLRGKITTYWLQLNRLSDKNTLWNVRIITYIFFLIICKCSRSGIIGNIWITQVRINPTNLESNSTNRKILVMLV